MVTRNRLQITAYILVTIIAMTTVGLYDSHQRGGITKRLQTIERIVGKRGLPGKTGAPGTTTKVTVTRGAAGKTGANGSTTTITRTVTIGARGVGGSPGPAGSRGPRGGLGPQGPQGHQGTAGKDGITRTIIQMITKTVAIPPDVGATVSAVCARLPVPCH